MSKFNVEFNSDECKGCELCISVCPKNIIALDKIKTNSAGYFPAMVTDIDKCIGCTSCALICPDLIITITKN